MPIVETTDEPNKELEDLSGIIIDNNHSPNGEEAKGDNTHGSQELMQVCPIETGAHEVVQLAKGGPDLGLRASHRPSVSEPRRPGREGREDRGCGHVGRSRPHSSPGEYSHSAYHIG